MKSRKKIGLTVAELAEGYMIPEKLTKAERAVSDIQLADALKKSRAGISEETVARLKHYQLKFQLEDYLKQDLIKTNKHQ